MPRLALRIGLASGCIAFGTWGSWFVLSPAFGLLSFVEGLGPRAAFAAVFILLWALPGGMLAAPLLWRASGRAKGRVRLARRLGSLACGGLGLWYFAYVLWGRLFPYGDDAFAPIYPDWDDIPAFLSAPALLIGVWLLRRGSRAA